MKPLEIFHKIVPRPEKPGHLPENIYWLSGEGCGSWFHINQCDIDFTISRFSPKGKLECKGIFKQVAGNPIDTNSIFSFTYLSHCAVVNIIQHEQKLTFNLIKKCEEAR